ncbi:ABC transporter ATP-binding protein [Mesoplasma entomophilum]|uniref:ABC transporter ATP-binding protein n=1 Tax=Mesoplasma entomophilum TaxID=2149 RepID=A0A3S5XZP6_9MOLU|nr:ABC transporter B family permease/ATP-binding protein [Mesoplasma entomophilum]ATQ35713.1 ABC transporter ATP-binding protein [Mesoplasma entomophilum]ATZ19683.1 ABC transporter ATP-binding protein [Mesoplasma entomophilum]
MSNNNQKQLNKHGFDVNMEFSFKKLGVFMRQIFESASQNKTLFFAVCFFTMLDALISTFLPVFATMMISGIMNDLAGPEKKETLSFLAWQVSIIDWEIWLYITLATLVLLFMSEYVVNWSVAQFSLHVEINQRQKMLIRLAQQDVDFFFDHVSGNILTRLVGDTQSLAFGIQQFFTNIIYFLTGIIMAVIIMILSGIWYVAVIMAVYMVFSIGIAVLIFIQNRRKLIAAFDRKREVDQDMTDRISNISLIKSSGLEEYEVKRVEDLNEIYNRAGDKAVQWSALLTQWIQITASAMMPLFVIIFCVAFLKNGNTELLLVKMPLAQVLVSFVVGAIAMLIPTLRSATRAQNAAQRISELTDPEPTIKPNPQGPEIEKINSITFENVSFAYPKKPEKTILPKMNITFEKGKSYAFVGETGSGKSTIAKLLLRFYMPVDGQIMVEGKYKNEDSLVKDSHDLNTINLPAYLSRVGYVEQEPQILFGDFFENIRYAKFDATDEEIMKACKKANLHDFIISLKDGYNTILGQRGFLLSGGQKQRLVIARVFLKNPDFLILDEATSALDNIVEKEIQAELDKLMKGRTSVTIAHRLSTIKNVDQIIVLGANGKGIVQQGTYDELISTPGRFKKLYEAGLMN